MDIYDFSVERPNAPENPQMSCLPYMFHMAIGQGIEKYRSYLIGKLEGLGDNGELIWKELIEEAEMMENHLNSGTNINYPRTLAEAKIQYDSIKE